MHPKSGATPYFIVFLFCCCFLFAKYIRKTWNFILRHLRCSTTCQPISKAHDILVGVYRFTLTDLICGTSRWKDGAKTLYNMLFIFYFSVSICCFFSYYFDCKDTDYILNIIIISAVMQGKRMNN